MFFRKPHTFKTPAAGERINSYLLYKLPNQIDGISQSFRQKLRLFRSRADDFFVLKEAAILITTEIPERLRRCPKLSGNTRVVTNITESTRVDGDERT